MLGETVTLITPPPQVAVGVTKPLGLGVVMLPQGAMVVGPAVALGLGVTIKGPTVCVASWGGGVVRMGKRGCSPTVPTPA